ncbi:MAG TPA: hypothetical protein VI728_09780, partial [Syntrophales bacterium]|nr:hypothetical protein [Syntrophales bacterium]
MTKKRYNAIAKTRYIRHGGHSDFLHDPLDGRTTLGRAYQGDIEALTAHLGGQLTLPQRSLIEQATRLSLLASIAWAEILRAGLFSEGQTS